MDSRGLHDVIIIKMEVWATQDYNRDSKSAVFTVCMYATLDLLHY